MTSQSGTSEVETIDAPTIDFADLPVRNLPPLRHIYPTMQSEVAYCGHSPGHPPRFVFTGRGRYCQACRELSEKNE